MGFYSFFSFPKFILECITAPIQHFILALGGNRCKWQRIQMFLNSNGSRGSPSDGDTSSCLLFARFLRFPCGLGPFHIAFTWASPASLFLLESDLFLVHLLELLQRLLATASSLDAATESSKLTIFESKWGIKILTDLWVLYIVSRLFLKGEKT